MAALARLQREDPVSNEDLEQARQHLIQSWKTFTIVEVSQPLVETAGRFADVFALRGYDRVQLAAAHELLVNAEQAVLLACYDRRLNQVEGGRSPRPRSGGQLLACGQLGLHLLHLGLVGGLEALIDLAGASQEVLDGWQQLLLQEGDLLLAVGVIDPEAGDRLALVAAEDPEQGPVAGLDQGDGILLGEPIEDGRHGRRRSGRQGGTPKGPPGQQGRRSAAEPLAKPLPRRRLRQPAAALSPVCRLLDAGIGAPGGPWASSGHDRRGRLADGRLAADQISGHARLAEHLEEHGG